MKTGIPEIDKILGEDEPNEEQEPLPVVEKVEAAEPPLEAEVPPPVPVKKAKTSWKDLERGDRALLNGSPVHVLQVDERAAKVFVRQEATGNPIGVFGSQLVLLNEEAEKAYPKEASRAPKLTPPSEPKAIMKLRNDLNAWNPVNFTQFNSIFGAAVRLGVIFEPDIAREVGVSVSTVRNWASGTLVPPRNVQEHSMNLIRQGLAQYTQRAIERERDRAQIEAIRMTTKGTEVIRTGQNSEYTAETRVNPAVGDLSMELGRSVKILEVRNQTFSCEMWRGEGNHWNAEVKDLGIRASGEHELDVVLDIKGSILRKLEEQLAGPQAPIEIEVAVPSVPAGD